MAYEYSTLDLVQAELRATEDFSSSTVPTADDVTTWIQQESAEVNQVGGRIYGETTYSEVLDYKGEETLLTSNSPITTVTSVLYSTSSLGSDTYSLDVTKVEDTDYTVYKDSGELAILSNWTPSDGRKRIQINYDAGFTDIPDTIEKLTTKKTAKRVIDTLLNKDINEKKSGKSVSVGSISIVKPADFGVKQYQQLKTDIGQLEKDIIGGTSLYRLPLHRF